MTLRLSSDRRVLVVVLTLVVIVGGGWWLSLGPATHAPERLTTELDTEVALQRRFDEAVLQLRSRRFEDALRSFERVIAMAPSMPEAHVNKGFALLGLQQFGPARQAFERATSLNPGQANAYYGLALSYEAGHDIELAMGAMRSYLHLATSEDEKHLAKARAALWEWESQRALQRQAAAR